MRNQSERLVIGWTCDSCDEAIGDEPQMWDIAEKLRKEHEKETGHTTTVKVVDEKRILPSQADRMEIGESILELAEQRGDRIEWICPNCQRNGEELDTTKRCPDCNERLREVIPDGGKVNETVTTPRDPFDPEDAMHVDEFPPFNGDNKALFAFDDDGNRYKVWSGHRFPSTKFIPESQWRETFMPGRDGVGERCAGCGRTIEWDAIIVNSEYHLRCYEAPEGGQ